MASNSIDNTTLVNGTLPMCSNTTLTNCQCEGDAELSNFNAEQAKVIFSCSVAGICLSMILFPYLLRHISRSIKKKKRSSGPEADDGGAPSGDHDDMPAWLCYLNAFGAGCFLSVSLLEFIPIVISRTPDSVDFPLGIFSIGLGFLIMSFMEHINWNALCGICSSKDKSGDESDKNTQNYTNVALSDTNGNNNGNQQNDQMYQQNNRTTDDGSGELLKVEGAGMTRSQLSGYSLAAQPRTKEEAKAFGFRRVLKLTLSFGPHAFMVGLAVGMGSSWAAIRGILMGIIPHKVIVNISLGVQYLHSKLTFKQAFILGGVFAGVMPLGVLAGHLLIHRIENQSEVLEDACVLDLEVSSGTANPVECIIQGLGAGTIFFVTFCELLPGELNADHHTKQRALIVILGFFVMSSLALFE
jgi:zinc transporter ZupT